MLQGLIGIKALADATAAFEDEERCRRLVEALVWPRGRICPACGCTRLTTLAGRDVESRPGSLTGPPCQKIPFHC